MPFNCTVRQYFSPFELHKNAFKRKIPDKRNLCSLFHVPLSQDIRIAFTKILMKFSNKRDLNFEMDPTKIC